MAWVAGMVLSLLVIIVGVNRKIHLGLTMFLGGLTLLIFTGLNLSVPAEVARLTLGNRTTLVLLLSLVLIEVLGNLLKQSGHMQRMIIYLGRLTGDLRLLAALLPSLIGILTVPGGAIFSAPLVAQVGEEAGISRPRQASINLWFRHALYFSFPLFPSMILAAELARVNVSVITMHNLLLSAAGLIIAFLVVFRGVAAKAPSREGDSSLESGDREKRGDRRRDLLNFASSVAPLAVVLLLAVAFKLIFPMALAAGITVALLDGIPLQQGCCRTLWHRVRSMLLPGFKINLALVVLGIMFFKQCLEFSGATAMLGETILGLGLPLLLLMFVFPAFVGAITGDNTASVAIVFPMFLPLLDPGGALYHAQVAFLFFASAWGHIFTPVHPCFTLTREYFKVSYTQILRPLLLPAGAVTALAVAQMLLLGALL